MPSTANSINGQKRPKPRRRLRGRYVRSRYMVAIIARATRGTNPCQGVKNCVLAPDFAADYSYTIIGLLPLLLCPGSSVDRALASGARCRAFESPPGYSVQDSLYSGVVNYYI